MKNNEKQQPLPPVTIAYWEAEFANAYKDGDKDVEWNARAFQEWNRILNMLATQGEAYLEAED